jgi:hypothetical protein
VGKVKQLAGHSKIPVSSKIKLIKSYKKILNFGNKRSVTQANPYTDQDNSQVQHILNYKAFDL